MSNGWTKKQIAIGLSVLLAIPLADTAQAPQQAQLCGQDVQGERDIKDQSQDINDQAKKSESDETQHEETTPSGVNSVKSQLGDQNGLSSTSQSGAEQKQNDAPKPVGTAAAPYEKTTGVAASRPAGAVIAPARQRRAHIILIRFAVVVGAAVAIGTVVALSQGSPSRP
jgi:hypothetical protein